MEQICQTRRVIGKLICVLCHNQRSKYTVSRARIVTSLCSLKQAILNEDFRCFSVFSDFCNLEARNTQTIDKGGRCYTILF